MAISKHTVPIVMSEATEELKINTQSNVNETDIATDGPSQVNVNNTTTQSKRSLAPRASAAKTKKTSRPRKTASTKENLTPLEAPILEPNPNSDTQQAKPIINPIPPNEEPVRPPLIQNQLLDTEQVQTFLTAIQNGKAVELSFVDAESNPSRIFEPRQLIFDAFLKGWYIWGWDRRYNTERHHQLNLMAQVSIIEGMGRTAPIACAYTSNASANLVGGLLGGDIMRVKVILLKQWIYAVRQAPMPFLEFKIEDIEDGKAQVTFIATDLRAVGRWVMQFGDGVQVLEPQRLVDRIKQVGLAWSGRSTLTTHVIKAAQHRHEQRQESTPEQHLHLHAKRHESVQDRRISEHNKHHHRESSDATKTSKIEIRTDRL